MMFTDRAVPGFMQGWSKRAYLRPEIQNHLADLRAPLGPPTFDYGVSESQIDHNAVRMVGGTSILPDSLGFHEQTRISEWLGLMQ